MWACLFERNKYGCRVSNQNRLLDDYDFIFQKLKKDRDFRINSGGFCPRKVTELKHVPGTRYMKAEKGFALNF